MEDYRFGCHHKDGSWHFLEFQFDDDDAAVAYGLRSRTSETCKLFSGDRLLATFDGGSALELKKASNSNFRLMKGVW